MSSGRRTAAVAAALLAALTVVPLAAGEKEEDGGAFFFGFNAAGGPFRGDCDGRLTLWHFDKAFAVPALPEDLSLGLSFGRRTKTGQWEVVFLQASKNTAWREQELGASLSLLEVRGRTWAFPRSPVRPFLFLGFGFPRLRVTDGARLGGSVDNTSFYGGNLVAGAGIAAALGPRLLLSVGAGYRMLWFLYAFGGGKGRDISKLTAEYGGEFFGRPLGASRLGIEAGLGIRL
ncbi:MAG: hypothetical protein JW747_06035 [Candidatus Aminicenantes bacterium]|nr:hypothetical protein [Candidatus Aminicenantes bacterium]